MVEEEENMAAECKWGGIEQQLCRSGIICGGDVLGQSG